jgi:hypothetical protein
MDTTSINDVLCVELLLCIFEYLNDGGIIFVQLRAVCKEWRNIVRGMNGKTIMKPPHFRAVLILPNMAIRVSNPLDFALLEEFGHLGDVHVTIKNGLTRFPLKPTPRVKSLTLAKVNLERGPFFGEFCTNWWLSVDSLTVLVQNKRRNLMVEKLSELIPKMKATNLTMKFRTIPSYTSELLSDVIEKSKITKVRLETMIHSIFYGDEIYSYTFYPLSVLPDYYAQYKNEYSTNTYTYHTTMLLNRELSTLLNTTYKTARTAD